MKSIKENLDDIKKLANFLPEAKSDELLAIARNIEFRIERNFSKLVDGLVPEGKACPYAGECQLKEGCPKVEPTAVNFSCGAARAFDLTRAGGTARSFMAKK